METLYGEFFVKGGPPLHLDGLLNFFVRPGQIHFLAPTHTERRAGSRRSGQGLVL